MVRHWVKWSFNTLTVGHSRSLSKNYVKGFDHYIWQRQACLSPALVLASNNGTLTPRGRWHHAVLMNRSEPWKKVLEDHGQELGEGSVET